MIYDSLWCICFSWRFMIIIFGVLGASTLPSTVAVYLATLPSHLYLNLVVLRWHSRSLSMPLELPCRHHGAYSMPLELPCGHQPLTRSRLFHLLCAIILLDHVPFLLSVCNEALMSVTISRIAQQCRLESMPEILHVHAVLVLLLFLQLPRLT